MNMLHPATHPNAVLPHHRQRHKKMPSEIASQARLFLGVACLWPLAVLTLWLLFFPSSESPADPSLNATAAHDVTSLESVLDRVDILGYGPTHPRVAAVITGSSQDAIKLTVESLLAKSDSNRLFSICVVLDGVSEDKSFVKELEQMEEGSVPHWHGLKPDLHKEQTPEEDPHGRKLHVMFNAKRAGVASSRADCVEFLSILQGHHERAGIKSTQEDLILLLLQAGAQLTSTHWLSGVTQALIVPPPLLPGHYHEAVSHKMANAVSFNVEGPGKRTSFDLTLTPNPQSEPTAADINLSSGQSYPTPALNGVATAMRLAVYQDLPLQDYDAVSQWEADLDLSLNLWLCADGIDMLSGVDVTLFDGHGHPPAPLPWKRAARLAAAWMTSGQADRFGGLFLKNHPDVTTLDWETALAEHKQALGTDLSKKCRSFEWYAEHINPDLSNFVDPSGEGESAGQPEAKEANVEVKKSQADKKAVADTDDFSIPERREDKKKPSKPLCKECLEIVQKAQPLKLEFEDVSGGNKEHPHMGARDVNGNLGYIHDATALHKNPPSFEFADLHSACAKRDNNYKMLHEKVFVDVKADKEAIDQGRTRDKIFCLVYTIDSGHPKIPAIRETWGQKCDGFMVGSNKTDPTIGAVDIVHEGPEEYNNIWQKVRSMWSYIYDNYYNDFDWFHIGGDDMYILIENLRLYLESEEIKTAANGGIYLPDGTETSQVPLFLGRRFAYQGDRSDIFNSGGSGYTLNKAALKALVVQGFPKFFPHAHTFSEDTMVARVLRQFGVYPYETKDESGGERYMPFMPGHHYGYRLPADQKSDWYSLYSIDIKEGLDHCAARSVAFHYVKGDNMKRLHALLYHLCPAETQ